MVQALMMFLTLFSGPLTHSLPIIISCTSLRCMSFNSTSLCWNLITDSLDQVESLDDAILDRKSVVNVS